MKLINRLLAWYEKHYNFHLKLSTFLFSLQIVHLFWLTIFVVIPKTFGFLPFFLPKWFNFLLALVDYTEIPALISISLIYINELKKRFSSKNFLLLIFLNSQYLHIFWITDEIVIKTFSGLSVVALPIWLAWLAIFIDYLELPVMYDTIKKYLLLKKYY